MIANIEKCNHKTLTYYVKHGVEVTLEQAEEILKFMGTLADLQVEQWLRQQEESEERAIEKS